MNINKSIIVKISLAGFLALALHLNANACPNCRDALRSCYRLWNLPENSAQKAKPATQQIIAPSLIAY